MRRILFLFILMAMTALRAEAAFMFDPSYEWKSLRTEHFWIHYHQGLEGHARRLTVIAERVHKKLSQEIKWQPYWRTDVVLVDNMDLANGFALPFPHNRVQIYISRPELDGVLNNFDQWLELVFTHEYTHILNLDTINGLPSTTRYTCGRVCFPNMFLPIWAIEGNAVYQESRGGIYGRNNSSYTDMILRTELAEDYFKSLSEASHYPRRWPTGNIPYLYGGLFVEFLERKYGSGSFAGFFLENSDNVLPFLINMNAKDVFGTTIPPLWKEWKEFLRVRFWRQMEAVKKEGITPFTRITLSGHNTTLPRFGDGGRSLYFLRSTNYDDPVLMRYSLENKKIEKLCSVNYPNSLSVTAGGAVFVSDLEYYKSVSLFNEAFVYEGKYRRLTRRLRGGYIDVLPDGRRAVYIRTDGDLYSLVLTDTAFRKDEAVITASDLQMAYPRFSPEGKRIAFTLKDRKGRSDLALLNLETGEIQRLTEDGFHDLQPAWHPDGKRLIFSSDRNGIYNLHELDLRKKTVRRITNLMGGAFTPEVSPDGRMIAFSLYGREGLDVATMPYPEKSRDLQVVKPSPLEKSFFQPLPAKETDKGKPLSPEDYSPWYSVLPTAWIPIFGSEEIYRDKYDSFFGFYTLGADTLYHNIYYLTAYGTARQKRATVDATYMYSGFYPDFIFEYRDETLFYGKDEFPWEEDNKTATKRSLKRAGAGGLLIPLIYFQIQQELLLYYSYEKTYTDYYIPGRYTREYTDILAKVSAVYVLNTSKLYSYSVSPEDGRSFFLQGDFYRKSLGSDISYSKARGEYAEYLPGIGRNNVLMLRLRGGAAFGNPDYLAPYNLGRFEKGKKGVPETGEDEFGLRGYPAGLVHGDRLAAAAAEYRLPVVQPDLGYRTLPFMLRDIWLTPFAEAGNVWSEKKDRKEIRTSAGMELHTRITLGYYIDLTGYIGAARGFNQDGETQVYFAISTFYEGALKQKRQIHEML